MGAVELDKEKNRLNIFAELIFYGNAASNELSKTVAADIQQYWNEPEAMVKIKHNWYKVEFIVSGYFNPVLTDIDVYENTDPRKNYFRIEEYAEGNISFVDGIGCNTGYFKLDNLLNNSSTAAHEFGHTIGLSHPAVLDLRGEGLPGIMYPRGTLTNPQFQYDPAAMPATPGGTMNPFFRKVLIRDILDLQLDKLSFNERGHAQIGDFSSVWHEAHIPIA